MFREDFMKACEKRTSSSRSLDRPPPSSVSDNEMTEQQLLRQAHLVHEFQRIEDRRGAWQQQVVADLGRTANGTLETGKNFEAVFQQLARIESQVAQKRQLDRIEAQLAQLQLSEVSAKPIGSSRSARAGSVVDATDMGGAASADAVSALATLVSATASQIESGISRRLTEMEQRTNERFADIRDRCARLQQDDETLQDMFKNKIGTQSSLLHAFTDKRRGSKEKLEAEQSARDPLAMLEEDTGETERERVYTSETAPGEDDDAIEAALAMMSQPTKKLEDDVDAKEMGDASYVPKTYFTNPDVERFFGVVQIASGVVIVLSLAFMGVSLLVAMPYVRDGHDPPVWLHIVDIVFLVVFVLELLMRLTLEKMNFFCGPHKWWNAVEAIITLLQMLEVLGVAVANIAILRFLRVFRLIRAVRLVQNLKSLRYFRQFMAVASCWQPFFWGFAAMVSMTYIFAVLIAQWLTDWRAYHGGNEKILADPVLADFINRYYGSLGDTMVSLFMASTGGVDWETVLRPFEGTEVNFRPILLVYMCVMVIGVMNILTAVYVERFMVASRLERDMQHYHAAAQNRAVVDELRSMLEVEDRHHRGKISSAVLFRVLTSKEGEAKLHKLKLDIKVIQAIFKLLDADRRGKVNIDEVCFAILHTKDSLATVQMAMVLFQSKRTLARVDRLYQILEEACSTEEELQPQSSESRRPVSRKSWGLRVF